MIIECLTPIENTLDILGCCILQSSWPSTPFAVKLLRDNLVQSLCMQATKQKQGSFRVPIRDTRVCIIGHTLIHTHTHKHTNTHTYIHHTIHIKRGTG